MNRLLISKVTLKLLQIILQNEKKFQAIMEAEIQLNMLMSSLSLCMFLRMRISSEQCIMRQFQMEKEAHLIIEFSQNGGFDNASGF